MGNNVNPVTGLPVEQPVQPAGGTVNPSGVPQNSGMPAQEPSDAEKQRLAQELENAKKLIEQRERDLRQLQSSLDSSHAHRELEMTNRLRNLEEQYHKAVTANMDEDERTKYEAERWKAKADEEAKERNKLQEYVENLKAQQEYARAFTELGIDTSKLDFSSPQALTTSGWQAVIEQINDLRSKVNQSQQQQVQPAQPPVQSNPNPQGQPPVQQQQRMTPPSVLTNQGATLPNVQTFDELRKAVGESVGRPNLTEEEMFRLAESGRINITDILKNIGGLG